MPTNNENLTNGAETTPGPQPPKNDVTVFGWKSILAIAVVVVVLLVGAYWVGSNGPNKFIREYEQFRIEAMEKNDSILTEVAQLRETINENDSQYQKVVDQQTATINRLSNQLRVNLAKLDSTVANLDSTRAELNDLPEVCAPAIKLADEYRFQLDTSRINLVLADSTIAEQEARNATQMLRIENMRHGFTQANIAIDSLGNIIGDLPKPPKFRILGIAVPKEAIFIAGVAVGWKLLK